MKYQYNDGGRAAAGFKGDAGDCVTRAIAIATGLPYRTVYDALFDGIRDFAARSRTKAARRAGRGGGRSGTTPRNGVHKSVYQPYLESLGWVWVPCMQIGSGCKARLAAADLPGGPLVVRLSKHLTAVIDGVIYDTHNPQRFAFDGLTEVEMLDDVGANRCVYGYFKPRESSDARN